MIIGCLAKRDVPGIQRASVYGKSEASGDLAKINLEEKNWKGKSKEINIKVRIATSMRDLWSRDFSRSGEILPAEIRRDIV